MEAEKQGMARRHVVVLLGFLLTTIVPVARELGLLVQE